MQILESYWSVCVKNRKKIGSVFVCSLLDSVKINIGLIIARREDF